MAEEIKMADKESAPFLSSARTPLSGHCLTSAYHESLSGELQNHYADKLQEANIADPMGLIQNFTFEKKVPSAVSGLAMK